MAYPAKGSRLLLLVMGQLVLLAGVGHAAMNGGAPGALHRLNHALHLLCAATGWVVYCRCCFVCVWRPLAASRYLYHDALLPRGHYAVAGVLLTGIINTLFIVGINVPWHAPYVQLLLFKCALVMMMVAIALANRYFLVPRFRPEAGREQQILSG